jgi:hypothetical protein
MAPASRTRLSRPRGDPSSARRPGVWFARRCFLVVTRVWGECAGVWTVWPAPAGANANPHFTVTFLLLLDTVGIKQVAGGSSALSMTDRDGRWR